MSGVLRVVIDAFVATVDLMLDGGLELTRADKLIVLMLARWTEVATPVWDDSN
jgi:hypothetical protein